ncbi:hypothetical protein L227DRAFT_611316 [Lentinus tigrinus ALCF2SS1-6]|uniref:Uncharacterized protein n=1 Tax=Lentinus tigrinus ALCF2SS1-6 TaxID=1328759 RepID=A0A5C2SB66_9APHY|nr:hypothetical protein L227DRAFT_611316 [Lentinus tigrinus ALCF2SS1-6]
MSFKTLENADFEFYADMENTSWSLKTAKATTDGVLDAAKAVDTNVVPGMIVAAQGPLNAVDKASVDSVPMAEETVKATEKAATDVLNRLTSCAEYIAFHAAQCRARSLRPFLSNIEEVWFDSQWTNHL